MVEAGLTRTREPFVCRGHPRAEAPETALDVLKAPQTYRVWANLGTLHKLMIAFAVAKKPELVVETLALAKGRQDIKPTDETFGIAIRCVGYPRSTGRWSLCRCRSRSSCGCCHCCCRLSRACFLRDADFDRTMPCMFVRPADRQLMRTRLAPLSHWLARPGER